MAEAEFVPESPQGLPPTLKLVSASAEPQGLKDQPQTSARDDDRGEGQSTGQAPSKPAEGAPHHEGKHRHHGKPQGPKKPPTPFYRHTAFWVFIILLILATIGGTVYWFYARHFEETDDAYITGDIVPITPQVSARVLKIYISDNQVVHTGDALVDLDPTDFDVTVAQKQGAEAAARGVLEQARTGVLSAQSAVAEAQAQVDSAQVSFENADRDLKRYQNLDERAKSQQTEDNAIAQQKTAKAAVEQAQAKRQSANSQVAAAKANVIAAEGDLQKAVADTRQAQVNLGYTHIVAPIDGRITNKNVDAGRYVTPAQPLFALVPSEVWIIANYKETQLTDMRPGQRVTISVDSYPDRTFNGTVQSIQSGTGSRFSIIPAENATGNFVKVVQRVPVKIIFDGDVGQDPNYQLVQGMSVEPKVRVRP